MLTLSSREILEYYKDLFERFVGQYYAVFEVVAAQQCLKGAELQISLIEDDWSLTIRASTDESGIHRIEIAVGVLLRVALLVNALNIERVGFGPFAQSSRGMLLLQSCDWAHRDPDASLWDSHHDSCLEAYLFPELRALILEPNDSLTGIEAIGRQWDGVFSAEEIINMETSIPVLWALDFLIYHEIAHIVLGHTAYFASMRKSSQLADASGDISDVLQEHRAAEGQADSYAIEIMCNTMDELKDLGKKCDLTELAISQLRNLVSILGGVFVLFGTKRNSVKFFEGLPHPMVDFRRQIFFDTVAEYLCKSVGSDAGWGEIFVSSRFQLHQAFNRIGGLGVEYSIFDAISSQPYIQKERVERAMHAYRTYLDEVRAFSRKLHKLKIDAPHP